MRTIKKNSKRWFAMVLSLVMCLGLLQTTSFAANWNPGDKITINVRVYDQSNGAVYNVGTDSVEKGNPELIQSVAYQIPQLTKFVSANQFGRVTKVVGNWYFPAGDSQPGANVEWSCNANSVTMTYWVNWYTNGSGSGSGSTGNDTVNIGGSGSNVWTQTITYHSNYPSGQNYSYKVTYNVRYYATLYNTSSIIKSLADVSFNAPNGYEAKTPIWNTNAAGTGTSYGPGSNFTLRKADNGKNLDLYAQWQTTGGTEVTPVTLTYMDGTSVYGTRNYFAGDTATAILCTTEKAGYTFAGWADSANSQTVKYRAGIEFIINSNMTLYAVWTPDAPTTTSLTVKKVVAGDLSASQLPSGFNMTATIINGSSVQTVFLNSAKLEDSVQISTTASTMVVLNESNYNVDGYDCTSTASDGSAVANGNVTITIPAGTVNPVCSITNTYVSNVEPAKQLTGIEKERLTSAPDGIDVTGVNLRPTPTLGSANSVTLLYSITVRGDVGANYTVTDDEAVYVGGAPMSGVIGEGRTAVIYVTRTFSFDEIAEGPVQNVAYVKAGANTDPIPGITPDAEKGTPSDPAITHVIGRTVTHKEGTDSDENRISEYTVTVTNKTGVTLTSMTVTDVMEEGMSIITESETMPKFTVVLRTKDGVESIPECTANTNGQTTTWTISDVEPGAEVILKYSALVSPELDDGKLHNHATTTVNGISIPTMFAMESIPNLMNYEDLSSEADCVIKIMNS